MATLIGNATALNNDWGQAFATNIIGLTGLDPANRKYVLQVYDRNGTTKLADVRVAPNEVGNAFIDIAYILQAQVGSKATLGINFEGNKPWYNTVAEIAELQLWYGEEDAAGVVTIDNTVTGLHVWRGKINDDDMAWQIRGRSDVNTFDDYPHSIFSFIPQTSKEGTWPNADEIIVNPYLPAISGGETADNCTFIQAEAAPLTDFRYYVPAGELTGVPANWASTLPVLRQKITKNRLGKLPLRTISILNGTDPNKVLVPLSYANSCAGYYITQYAGSLLLSQDLFENTLPNGGGPNTNVTQGIEPYGPYNLLHATIYDNMFTLDSSCTHFYVHFVVPTANGCVVAPVGEENFLNQPAWYPVRYDIEDACSDYSPMTVRWLNSAGGYDYFQFNKKHDRTIKTDRNAFRANKFDYWKGSAFNDLRLNDRGEKIYSQRIQKEVTLSTDWLYDYEAEFLESLFKSAEVGYIDQDKTYGENQVQQVIQATITNKSIKQKSYRRNKLFQFEITLKGAHNVQSQRG